MRYFTGLLRALIVSLVIITLLISLTLIYLYFFDFIKPREIQNTYIEIKKGESIRGVAQILKEKSILKHKLTLLIFARGKFKKVKAGEYYIEGKVSPADAIEMFIKGEFVRRSITVVPGWTIYHIANELEKQKIIEDKDEFLRLSQNREFLEKIGINYDSAEGFLYPDTYFFFKNSDPKDVISTLVENFYRKIGHQRLKEMEKKGFYEKLILASIVESESTYEAEKPLIASVFINRLKIGMPLQADPTILYGLKLFDLNSSKIFERPPTPMDLRKDSPYNTYIYAGLPPTPICNPIISSIDAVLNPPKTKLLYFVAKGDGTHFFAEDYQKHLQNIKEAMRLKMKRYERNDMIKIQTED